jgi:hypothetical protein
MVRVFELRHGASMAFLKQRDARLYIRSKAVIPQTDSYIKLCAEINEFLKTATFLWQLETFKYKCQIFLK